MSDGRHARRTLLLDAAYCAAAGILALALAAPFGRLFHVPAALLAAYRAALRPDTVYIADLDRITGRDDNDAVLEDLLASAPEVRFLWDGGFSDAASIARVPRDGRIVPERERVTSDSVLAPPALG